MVTKQYSFNPGGLIRRKSKVIWPDLYFEGAERSDFARSTYFSSTGDVALMMMQVILAIISFFTV